MNKKNYLKYLTMLLATGAAMPNGGVPSSSSTMPTASSSVGTDCAENTKKVFIGKIVKLAMGVKVPLVVHKKENEFIGIGISGDEVYFDQNMKEKLQMHYKYHGAGDTCKVWAMMIGDKLYPYSDLAMPMRIHGTQEYVKYDIVNKRFHYECKTTVYQRDVLHWALNTNRIMLILEQIYCEWLKDKRLEIELQIGSASLEFRFSDRSKYVTWHSFDIYRTYDTVKIYFNMQMNPVIGSKKNPNKNPPILIFPKDVEKHVKEHGCNFSNLQPIYDDEEDKSGDEHSEADSDGTTPQSDAESSSDPICNPAPIDIAFRQLPEERVIIISTNRLDYLKGRLLSGEEYPISPTLLEQLKEFFRTPNYTDLLKQPQSKPLVIIGDKIFKSDPILIRHQATWRDKDGRRRGDSEYMPLYLVETLDGVLKLIHLFVIHGIYDETDPDTELTDEQKASQIPIVVRSSGLLNSWLKDPSSHFHWLARELLSIPSPSSFVFDIERMGLDTILKISDPSKPLHKYGPSYVKYSISNKGKIIYLNINDDFPNGRPWSAANFIHPGHLDELYKTHLNVLGV